MVDRRNLVRGGLVAGMASMVTAEEAVAQDTTAIIVAIEQVRGLLERQLEAGPAIGLVRAQQRQWMRSSQKFPDFIEIGIGIWEALHDWHVRFQQPLNVSRAADGRYVMAFHFTTLILRTDVDPGYVGPAFDGTRAPQP
jgi:hypothetical protein